MKNWEKKLLITTVSLSLALIPLYLLGIYFKSTWEVKSIFNLLDLDGEANIISWYSSILLFSSCLCLFALSRTTKNKQEKLSWLGLSAFFLLLSLDEVAEMHTLLGSVLNALLIKPLFSADAKGYPWVLVGLPAVIALFFVWKKTLQHAMPRKAKYAALIGLLCFVIAMLAETVALFLFAKGVYGTSAATTVEIVIEETFELFGMISFLYAFLLTLQKRQDFKSRLSRI